MADANGGGGGGQTAAPSQGGQAVNQPSGPAPGQQRARVGEFNAFSSAGIQPALSQQTVFGADGQPGQSIGLQNPGLVDRQQGADPFDPFGTPQDAQSMALAVEDDPLAPIPQGEGEGEVHQAQVVSADEIRAWIDEYQAWKKADDLPDVLHDKFVVAQVNGQRFRIPVSEAVKGYQLHTDYSNKLRELYAYKASLEQREAGLQKLLVDMDDGHKFLDAMVFLGKFPGFAKAAIIYGTQLDAERRMTPEQREVHRALRAQRAELQRLEIENRTLKAQQAPREQQADGGPSVEQIRQIYLQQLSHIAPKVAAQPGFVNTPLSQTLFEKHFNAQLPGIAGQDLTSEFVERVMRAAMDDVELHVAGHNQYLQRDAPAAPPAQQPRVPSGAPQGGQFARRQPQLPPVSAGPGPAGAPLQQRQQRMRISDFNNAVRGRV